MFFTLSKIFWYLFTPSTLIVLLLCVWRRRWALCLALILLVFPIGDVLYKWEHQFPAFDASVSQVEGIIVLGGVIDPKISNDNKTITFHSAAERMTSLISLTRQYPKALVVFSGGSGDIQNPDLREADYAARLLDEWNVPEANLRFERESRNTYENALFSKQKFKPKGKWILVTSAAHMPRSKAVFDKLEWDVIPHPVDYRAESSPDILCFCLNDNLRKLDTLFHEWFGLQVYRLTGKAV